MGVGWQFPSYLPFFFSILLFVLFQHDILAGKSKQEIVHYTSKDGTNLRFTFRISDKDIDEKVASFCKNHSVIDRKRIFDDSMHVLYGRKQKYLICY